MYSPRGSLLLTVVLLLSRSILGFIMPRSLHHSEMVVGRRFTKNVSSLQANFLENLFKNTRVMAPSNPSNEEEMKNIVKKEIPPPVVIDRDYRLAGVFLAVGFLLDVIPYVQILLGIPMTLLGILFLIQTYRVRFVFDENNNLDLRIGDNLAESGENLVVGGANVWSCDTIVNYDFFPTGWIDNPVPFNIPILVYFKETQTDPSTWNQGPGKTANDPDKIASGRAVAGQVHFFPAVCNAKQIRSEFEKRKCGKIY